MANQGWKEVISWWALHEEDVKRAVELEGTMNTGADEALLSGILVPEKLRLKSRGCFADGVPATNVRTKHCLRGSRRDKWEERRETQGEARPQSLKFLILLGSGTEQSENFLPRFMSSGVFLFGDNPELAVHWHVEPYGSCLSWEMSLSPTLYWCYAVNLRVSFQFKSSSSLYRVK